MRLAARNDVSDSLSFESIAANATTEQAIDRWLDMVSRLSRINERDRDELKDELAAHLHDRVRDLELAGHEEHAALRKAIAELGDAAQLARSISEAHRYPRRRIIMNCTIVGLGLAALGVGLVSYNGVVTSGQGRAFEGQQAAQIEQSLPQRTDINFSDTPLTEAVEFLDAMTDRSIYVHWRDLFDYGITRDDPERVVNLKLENVSLGKAMSLLLEQLPDGDGLAWRVGEELIELGVAEEFDRREVVLVAYDISAATESLVSEGYNANLTEAQNHIATLMMEMAEPEKWEDYGGAVARYNAVGGKLFIQAPPRMHERVQWLLSELEADAGVAAGDHGGDEQPGRAHAMTGVFKAGDLVTFEVFELFRANEWGRMNRVVDDSGSIRVPELGDVEVLGKTPNEVEATIAAKLADVIVDPAVMVYHTPPTNQDGLAEMQQSVRQLQEQLHAVTSQLDTTLAANRALQEELARVTSEDDPLAADVLQPGDK